LAGGGEGEEVDPNEFPERNGGIGCLDKSSESLPTEINSEPLYP
jgi:hypothetical protein